MKKRNTIFYPVSLIGVSSLLILGGCGGSSSSSSSSDSMNATTYEFFDTDGNSTVYYDGQNARQILISEVKDAASALSRTGDENPQAVIDDINLYITTDAAVRDAQGGDWQYDSIEVGLPDGTTDSDGINAGQVSSGDRLENKMAGNDPSTLAWDNVFYSGQIVSDPAEGIDVSTPALFIQGLVASLANEITDSTVTTTVEVEGTGPVAIPAYVSAEGHDFAQLLQKGLLGVVTFNQGTADYLSTNWESKLVSDGGAYIAHKFDEGWGYFGGATDYGQLTDSEIKNGYNDTNSDGILDIGRNSSSDAGQVDEFNFGNSVNCAKRDVSGQSNTDFTSEANDAFLTARGILQDVADADAFSGTQLADLNDQIIIATQTWEKCIAATVVHYINDVIDDMDDFGQSGFSSIGNFTDLAKHWGEMFGFAIGLQFSPYSPFRTGYITDGQVAEAATVTQVEADYAAVLNAFGTAPVLYDGTMDGEAYPGGVDAYALALEAARDILRDAYGFTQAQASSW
jgi:hypothetical protein